LALGAVAATFLFTGCATTELQTQTKMTQSIFLDPVKKELRTVFVSVKNTSGQDMGGLEQKINSNLQAKGYRLVDDPDTAKYTLMTNVLFANNLKEANAAGTGANGAVLGGVMGAVNSGGNGRSALGAALVVGGISTIAGKLTEDEIYRMVTDVVVRDRKDTKVLTTVNTNQGQVSIGQEARAGFTNSFAADQLKLPILDCLSSSAL
jgi:outer membrane lipoprotein SlyB